MPAHDLAAAHAKAGAEFSRTIRRIRDNILRFQSAILHSDVEVESPNGSYLRQRYLPLGGSAFVCPAGRPPIRRRC